jgi:RNA polymerase sigma-70 factor (ECF subfamily)
MRALRRTYRNARRSAVARLSGEDERKIEKSQSLGQLVSPGLGPQLLPGERVLPDKLMAMARTDIQCDPLELVVRAQGGSMEAMEDLIVLYQERVAGFIYSMAGAADQLPDLCQTTFVKMISGLPRLKSPESFEVWLFRIARNACTDHFRQERWRRMLVPFRTEHEPIDSRVPSDGRLAMFKKALGELPPRQRELIVLRGERDWSYEDLARITGSSLSSVKSRLFRAREFLRRRMND